MPQIHTHYDNLKVSRNAPQEVIRAAYKVLSQKYHPDRNKNKVDATRVMTLINESYSVLSDEESRFEHDQWIVYQEKIDSQPINANSQSNQKEFNTPPPAPAPSPVIKEDGNTLAQHFFEYWAVYLIVIGGIWLWSSVSNQTQQVNPKSYQNTLPQVDVSKNALPELEKPQSPQVALQVIPPIKDLIIDPATLSTPLVAGVKKSYERPALAPNDSPWPQMAGYVSGYPRMLSSGLSTVTVDNSQNDAEVFVKLVSLDSAQLFPARQFYIPAFGSFKLNNVTAGNYDVRYRDLSNGQLSRSEAFVLSEEITEEGRRYSNITMTLYKIKNGNMQTYGLPETEF